MVLSVSYFSFTVILSVLSGLENYSLQFSKSFDPEKYHLELKIKSSYLNSLSRLSAHKMIMKVLKSDLDTKIHALEIIIEQ